MPGEHDLDTLLGTMRPAMSGDEFVFSTGPRIEGEPLCAFREAEGWTLVLRRAEAERLGLPSTYPCRQITLTVHSSLDAVGLLAAVSAALAARGISVNVVSAYYHDHLFVPIDRADETMAVLAQLSG